MIMKTMIFASFLHAFLLTRAWSLTPPLQQRTSNSHLKAAEAASRSNDTKNLVICNRRIAISTGIQSAVVAAAATSWTPTAAVAASSSSSSSPLTLQNLLNQLRVVPTFCLVNPEGASYMLISKNGEAFAKGYAFTTFSGALAVLGDAERAAEKGGYADTWKGATITVVPADIAVRLALQPTKRQNQKEQSLNTLVDIIPGIDDREVAIQLDRKFSDQGKVPLFYFDEMLTADGSSLPLYLNKSDLLSEWIKQNGDTKPPKTKVLDLVTMFQYVLRGRAEELPIKKNVVFVPNADALEASKELKARGLVPYKPDQMVV